MGSFSDDGSIIQQDQQVQEYPSVEMSDVLRKPRPAHNAETNTFRLQQSESIPLGSFFAHALVSDKSPYQDCKPESS